MIEGEVPESIPNINDDTEETSFASFNFPGDEESIKGTLLVCTKECALMNLVYALDS
jgi:hypothetical protein